MKKLLFFILVFIMSMMLVRAADGTNYQTYYSDYGPFSDYQIEAISNDELTEVEVERRYLYYKEVKEIGGYYLEGTNPSEYSLINKEDSLLTDYSDWSLTKTISQPNRLTEERQYYEYTDALDVRYIHFYNLSGSYGALRISELEITVNNVSIDYAITCRTCSTYFLDNIHDGNIFENMSVIYNGGYFDIDLGNYYPLSSIAIQVSLYDQGNEPKIYTISITRGPSVNDITHADIVMYQYFKSVDFNDIKTTTFNIDNIRVLYSEYHPWVRSETPVTPRKARMINQFNEYRYQDTEYSYYRINKEYATEYMVNANPEYTIKDETLYRDYYRYRNRQKLVLKEPFIINTPKANLDSFIIESSGEVLISGAVDYQINGIYPITITNGNISLTKEVTIAIPDNDIIPEPIIEEVVVPDLPKEEVVPGDNLELVDEVISDEVIPDSILVVPPITVIPTIIKVKAPPVITELPVTESVIEEIVVVKPIINDQEIVKPKAELTLHKNSFLSVSNNLLISLIGIILFVIFMLLIKNRKKSDY